MSEPEANRGDQGGNKLYTLSEISQKTGISMPTLQRYKKLYQSRIPSEGKGRKQRYPDHALPVFEEIKTENAGKRGRPRKDASAPAAAAKRGVARGVGRGRGAAKKPAAATPPAPVGRPRGRKAGSKRGAAAAVAIASAGRKGTGRRVGRPSKQPVAAPVAAGRRRGTGNLLTLTQISETTGISYPTLVRYVRLYSDRLPHEGTGRARRFYPQAVDAFRQLRSESGRGGRKKGSVAGGARRGRPPAAAAAASTGREEGGLSKRLKAIEKSQQNLEKRFLGFVKSLQKLFR